MNKIIIVCTILFTTLAACNNSSNKSKESQNSSNNNQAISQTDNNNIPASTTIETKTPALITAIVNAYLQLKNNFTEDNSIGAANAGKSLEMAFKNFNKSTLTSSQKKTFEDVEDDAREHAEHIGKNGGNIAHQREHFELLSKDIYDLIKTFGAGQVLYKDFDQMYNKGKGAFWISETKEIKNPYMGKTMSNSGSIIEIIK